MTRINRFLLFVLSAWAAAAIAVEQQDCKFDISRENDNYCDCPHTSQDETKTSACAPVGRFRCADRPNRVSFPSSRVHDGVCDCCDGSDEPQGLCSNSCAEDDRIEREREEQQRLVKKQGEDGFFELFAKSKQLIACAAKADAKEGDAEEKKKVTAEDLQEAQEKVNALEKEEELGLTARRIRSLHLASLSRRDLERLVVQLAAQTSSGVKLERLVADLSPCSAKSEVDDTYGSEPSDEEGEAGEDVEEDETKTEDEVTCDPVWLTPSHGEDNNEMGIGKQEELELARATVHEIQSKLDESKTVEVDDSKIDYGPGKVWKALKNECFSLKKDKYTYELCLFKDFTQDTVRLGRWHGWTSAYNEMFFDSGDMCYSPAVARSIRIKVECGATTALLDVYEPSTCVYQAHLQSPAACVPDNFVYDEAAVETCSASS